MRGRAHSFPRVPTLPSELKMLLVLSSVKGIPGVVLQVCSQLHSFLSLCPAFLSNLVCFVWCLVVRDALTQAQSPLKTVSPASPQGVEPLGHSPQDPEAGQGPLESFQTTVCLCSIK